MVADAEEEGLVIVFAERGREIEPLFEFVERPAARERAVGVTNAETYDVAGGRIVTFPAEDVGHLFFMLLYRYLSEMYKKQSLFDYR